MQALQNLHMNNLHNKVALVCTCDSNYVPCLLALLQSIKQNSDGYHVYIALINSPITNGDLIRSVYPNCTIDYHQVDLPNKIVHNHPWYNVPFFKLANILRPKNRMFGVNYKHLYYNNYRYRHILDLIGENTGYEYLLYIDVDTIIRRDITPILQECIQYDISSYIITDPIIDQPLLAHHLGHFDFNKKQIRFNTTMLGVHTNPACKDYIEKIYKHVEDVMEFGYEEYLCYEHFCSRNLVLFNWAPYIDVDKYNTDQYIWTGFSDNKTHNKIYLSEFGKYNSAIANCCNE